MPWMPCIPARPPLSTGERAGSTAMMRTPDPSALRRTWPTPVIVPPGPKPATNPRILPPAPTHNNKRVDLPARGRHYLLRSRAFVDLGVGFVLELLRHEAVLILLH